jgi:hypothetical protein
VWFGGCDFRFIYEDGASKTWEHLGCPLILGGQKRQREWESRSYSDVCLMSNTSGSSFTAHMDVLNSCMHEQKCNTSSSKVHTYINTQAYHSDRQQIGTGFWYRDVYQGKPLGWPVVYLWMASWGGRNWPLVGNKGTKETPRLFSGVPVFGRYKNWGEDMQCRVSTTRITFYSYCRGAW